MTSALLLLAALTGPFAAAWVISRWPFAGNAAERDWLRLREPGEPKIRAEVWWQANKKSLIIIFILEGIFLLVGAVLDLVSPDETGARVGTILVLALIGQLWRFFGVYLAFRQWGRASRRDPPRDPDLGLDHGVGGQPRT